MDDEDRGMIVMSEIQGFSILEKIEGWRMEQGIGRGVPPTKIPRPYGLVAEEDQ